jgi:hypothetical protein
VVEDEGMATRGQGPCLIVVSGGHDETVGARLVLTPGEKVVVGRKSAIFDGETLGDSRISSRHCELGSTQRLSIATSSGCCKWPRRRFRVCVTDAKISVR